MSKTPGIGSKKVLPVPSTKFERDLIMAIEDILKELDDYLTSLETRIEALEP